MTKFKKGSAWLLYCSLFLYITLTSFAPADGPASASFRFKTVIIDAGHGGKDPGAHGAYSKEKDVSLAIAKKVRDLLQDDGELNVVMTRTSDKFVQLNKRAQIANSNKGNLFVSIHCNSLPGGTASRASRKGVLLLVYGFHRKQEQMEALRENASIYIEKDYQKNYGGYDERDPSSLIVLNAFMQKYRKQSIQFGELLNKEFKTKDDRRSAGVKEQGLLVLAHSAMPAVLVETGYINNASEERYLNSQSGQNAIARSIVNAIRSYRREVNSQ